MASVDSVEPESRIPFRPLGKNGPLVNRIGYGTMGLAFSYGPPLPDDQRLAVLDHAHRIGQTFWDTSDIYGDAEDLLSKWFARTNQRADIFLATKFGGLQHPDGSFGFRGDAAYVREACEKSLARLGTDYIDLWYPHRLEGSTPVEHIVGEMAKLVAEGKVRFIGLSEVSSSTLRRAHKIHPIAAVQMEYSPFSIDIESDQIGLLKTCRELGVAVVAYSPLARGMVTGQIKSVDDFGEGDTRKFFPRFSAENFPKNMKVVGAFSEIADQKGCTPGQLALAWLLRQGDDIFPIPGSTKIQRVEENFTAANVELSESEVTRIRELVDDASRQQNGARYPPEFEIMLLADTISVEDFEAATADQGRKDLSQ